MQREDACRGRMHASACLHLERRLEAEDDGFTPDGDIGYYAYDAGGWSYYGETETFFGNMTVYLMDDDEDGVADDSDNCEFEANPSQEDSDDDGIGDACDEETEPPEPTEFEEEEFEGATTLFCLLAQSLAGAFTALL